LGIRSFASSCLRLLRLATKPSASEYWLSIKISFLGVSIVGAIGFVIKIIATYLVPP
jgi:protein translocase SEC61 complex gamma subunit